MQTAYGYAIRNNKGDEASSIAAIWTIYHHMIMVSPEESVESQHSYCPNDDKSWCKYHKNKIFNTNIYDLSKCLRFVFCGELHEFFTRLSSPDSLRWIPLTKIRIFEKKIQFPLFCKNTSL